MDPNWNSTSPRQKKGSPAHAGMDPLFNISVPCPSTTGGQSEMQLVNQPGAKILTHRLDAAANLHVAALGGELRLLQRRLDTVGHEDEGGAAVHLDRIARMVR